MVEPENKKKEGSLLISLLKLVEVFALLSIGFTSFLVLIGITMNIPWFVQIIVFPLVFLYFFVYCGVVFKLMGGK